MKNPHIKSGSLALIGNTPLIKLNNIVPKNCAEVWIKYEGGNPTGSYKDRMAHSVLSEAVKTGKVKKGQRVVEYTGGSTGSSLAYVCSALGLKFTAIFSDAFSISKKMTMDAFGAKVIIEKSYGKGITSELINRMKLKAKTISEKDNTFYVDQFGSPDVIKGYIPMGREISNSLGKIDVFCSAVGTGGALMGTWKGLKKDNTSLIAFEPKQSPFLTTGKAGAHKVEGIGVGFYPPFLNKKIIDEVRTIDQESAFEMCRKLARKEGVFCGGSTGMNVVGAIEIAKELGSGSKVVTLACDNGIKYLGSHIYNI